jgi:ribosomal protein S18 acetylase RimI-like enzyme
LAVEKGFRGRGIGRSVLGIITREAIVNGKTGIYLHVHTKNTGAMQFYADNNFIEERRGDTYALMYREL